MKIKNLLKKGLVTMLTLMGSVTIGSVNAAQTNQVASLVNTGDNTDIVPIAIMFGLSIIIFIIFIIFIIVKRRKEK